MSKHDRGSTDEIERNDWRTPPKLFQAIQDHYGVTCVLDAAADPRNTLCAAWLGKEDNTPRMALEDIQGVFGVGFGAACERLQPGRIAGIWCNPEYHSGEELFEWVDKAAGHSVVYTVPWLLLVPASRSEQDWFHHALQFEPQVTYIKGRVPYLLPDGTPGPSPNHPSLVLAFGAPMVGKTHFSTIEQPWLKDEQRARRVAKRATRQGMKVAA